MAGADYFPNGKLKKMTEELYASGHSSSVKKSVFCDRLKDILSDTLTLWITTFGVYYKDDKLQCWKENFKAEPMKQIEEDLTEMLRISGNNFDTIIDILVKHDFLITARALMMILFLIREERFLAIDKKSTLVNILKRFGEVETGHELELQEKLIEIKGKNKIMNDWSNYYYSYFI